MLSGGGGVRQVTSPVQVRLTGVVRGSVTDDAPPTSVSAPTVAEATAALNRAAVVAGAENVVHVQSDYRRDEIATGLSVQTRIEVQAWGTAVKRAEELKAKPETESTE